MLKIVLGIWVFIIFVAVTILIAVKNHKYTELEDEILNELGILDWYDVNYIDEYVTVKSRRTLENYDEVRYFKEHEGKLKEAEKVLKYKKEIADTLKDFLQNNDYKNRWLYNRVEEKINGKLRNAKAYRVCVEYISSAGNNLGSKEIVLTQYDVNKFKNDPTLLMSKGEYNKYIKEKQRIALDKKQHSYYNRVNKIIGIASDNRDDFVIKGSAEQVDALVGQLFDRTVNSIKKIKTVDSEEWDVIGEVITQLDKQIQGVINCNRRILAYYASAEFQKIKETCSDLMSSQREFNDYIKEKVETISKLFGSRVVRSETINDDEYQYIRPYKKTITPFTAEVSAAVFSSAENNSLDYVVKYFYSDKTRYPEQIQKLHLLVEELATLKDARKIIENYKADYRRYMEGVPSFVLEGDESGFYSRLGFANVDENALVVEYKFSYTSGGGMAKRTFSVPMTEETIVDLIRKLEDKLTIAAFTREQRALMTEKLREHIKLRDNFTCCSCGNSTEREPNLLLEIDHIVPVSKGGATLEENLQTLCWKCNRSKGSKL